MNHFLKKFFKWFEIKPKPLEEFPYLVLGSLFFERKERDTLKKKIKTIQEQYEIKGELCPACIWRVFAGNFLNSLKTA